MRGRWTPAIRRDSVDTVAGLRALTFRRPSTYLLTLVRTFIVSRARVFSV